VALPTDPSSIELDFSTIPQYEVYH
jgi:hypothetical protein